MATPEKGNFEHGLISDLSRYNNLETDKDRMAFLIMVDDYMDHVRSNPAERPGWDEAKEKATAVQFLNAITSPEVAWPLACQVAPEFKQPLTYVDDSNPILSFIMKQVSHLAVRPKITVTDDQRGAEEVIWHKWQRQIEYVAYLAGSVEETSAERRQEADKAVSQMKAVADIAPCLGSPPDKKA